MIKKIFYFIYKMDYDRMEDLFNILKTYKNYSEEILKDLENLCDKYENYEKKIPILNNQKRIGERIKREKEIGEWKRMKKCRKFFLKENPNEQCVYDKYIKISEKYAQYMINDYRKNMDIFDKYFKTGI